MKKFIVLITMLISLMSFGVKAQDVITVVSGTDTLVSGLNDTAVVTICSGESLVMTTSFNGTLHHVSWTSNPPGLTGNLLTVSVTPTTTTDYYVYVFKDGGTYVGNIMISVFVSPLPTIYDLTIDGIVWTSAEFCDYPGATGLVDGISDSDIGITYQLQLDSPPNTVLDTQPGTGNAIQFAPQTEGSFRIIAINSFGCEVQF